MFKSLIFIFIFISSGFTSLLHSETQKNQVKAIVFDFEGVLASRDPSNEIHFLMKSLNLPYDELKLVLNQLKFLRNAGVSERHYWQLFTLSRGLLISEQWFAQLETMKLSTYIENREMVMLVLALRTNGYRIGLLANMDLQQAEIMQKLGYHDLFDPLLISCQTGIKKPDIESYGLLLNELELPASDVLLIDKDFINVEAAQSMGIDSIQFTSVQQLKEELDNRGISFYMDQNKPIFVGDPNSLLFLQPLEQKSKKLSLVAGVSLLAAVASVAMLACKLFGWTNKGHWGLYLTIAATSVVVLSIVSNQQAWIRFEIANKIYSVLELAKNNISKIDNQLNLQLHSADYALTGA